MKPEKPLRRFILRSLLAAMPVFIVVALYIGSDPYSVVRGYREPYGPSDTLAVNYNAGYVSIETYKRYNATRRFNAFILGSSMSQNYKAEWWKAHLPADASVCHLDASMESVEGIKNKLLFLERDGAPVRYALVVMEEEMFHRSPRDNEHLFAQHPATTSAASWIPFQLTFFKAFKRPEFVAYAIAPKRFTHLMDEAGILMGNLPCRIEEINENYYARFDSLIAANPDEFFTPQRLANRRFRELPRPLAPAIDAERLAQLQEMKALFERQHTQYVIIIPPRYQRVPLHCLDRAALEDVFGSERVFDFSTYKEMSDDPRCYYDNPAHLISSKCKMLLDSVYSGAIRFAAQ